MIAPGSEQYRRLFGVAYRITGSVHDAEDAVQEGLARWERLTDHERALVREPMAWLTRVVSRVCLDELASARSRRESYVGIWLPEPVLGELGEPVAEGVDPAEAVSLAESVSLALLVAMERLTPAERVALILHDVFGLSFAEVADVVGRTPAACRQLASSARANLRESRRFDVPGSRRDEVVAAFARASMDGDVEGLARVLDPAVISRADGGEHIRAARRDVVGAETVANYLLGVLAKQRARTSSLRPSLEPVNGRTGIVMRDGDTVIAAIDLAIDAGRVCEIAMIVNPDKLRHAMSWTG